MLLAISISCFAFDTKYDISSYQGDGVLTYKPKAGWLGSEGYTLAFERFALSQGLNQTFSLPALPVPSKGNSFFLIFKPEKEIPTNLVHTVHISTILKDDVGNTVWDIHSTLEMWTKTDIHGVDYYDCYYCYCSLHSEPSFCRFIPNPTNTYYLKINFAVTPLSDNIPRTGYFYLDAGGFK